MKRGIAALFFAVLSLSAASTVLATPLGGELGRLFAGNPQLATEAFHESFGELSTSPPGTSFDTLYVPYAVYLPNANLSSLELGTSAAVPIYAPGYVPLSGRIEPAGGLDIQLIASHWVPTSGLVADVAAPEPSTLTLAAWGGIALVGVCLRRATRK